MLVAIVAYFGLGVQSKIETNILASSFVFVGEQGPTTPKVSRAPVRVITVLDGNDFARKLKGKTVYTNLPGRAGRFVFFTNGLSYAKSMLLGEVARSTTTEAASFGMKLDDGDRTVLVVRLAQRIKGAAAVVKGIVTDIREPRRTEREPETEHDPEWMVATVVARDVLKGQRRDKYDVVFPGSDDPLWEKLPKFKRGDVGTFILSSQKLFRQPPNTFSLGSPLDFQDSKNDALVVAAMRRGG